MNDQLQQALADIINKALSGIDAGASFLQSELPDVVQQLLMFKLVSSALTLVVSVSVIVCYAWLLRAYAKAMAPSFFKTISFGNEETTFAGFMMLLVWGVSSFIALIMAVRSAGTALKILLAPKIYLIEYAAALVR